MTAAGIAATSAGTEGLGHMASTNRSLWQRIVRWVRPPAETYETRQVRAAGSEPLSVPFMKPTDQRRHGGSAAIGGH